MVVDVEKLVTVNVVVVDNIVVVVVVLVTVLVWERMDMSDRTLVKVRNEMVAPLLTIDVM